MSAPRLRATRQRTAVAKLLDDTEGFRSAQEIHEKLRGQQTERPARPRQKIFGAVRLDSEAADKDHGCPR